MKDLRKEFEELNWWDGGLDTKNKAIELLESTISQTKQELIEEIKKFKNKTECPLYVCCDDCYKLSIQDVLNYLEKLSNK